ncbi:MAG: N-acetyltransferase [candidate division Zixibacteria bacterium]|nr:N-acetyltransferase [candidate division Zixibacteria bacterium]
MMQKTFRRCISKAFDNSEAQMISDFAVNLLNENHPVKTISLVAIENNEIVGHTAFSPVFFESTNEHFGYILTPLAVSPKFQKNKIGSSLVNYGLDIISNIGSFIVFVYGDPQYYSRFGFKTDLSKNFIPPYTLQFPEGWHALKLNSAVFPEGGIITCVDSLNDSNLW